MRSAVRSPSPLITNILAWPVGQRLRRLESALPDPSRLRLERIAEEGGMVLSVASSGDSADCPSCRRPTRSVHSRYERKLRDLPWHGLLVQVRLRVRRFRCRSPECRRKIFVERLAAVASAYGRQTARLAETLRLLGYALEAKAAPAWPRASASAPVPIRCSAA